MRLRRVGCECGCAWAASAAAARSMTHGGRMGFSCAARSIDEIFASESVDGVHYCKGVAPEADRADHLTIARRLHSEGARNKELANGLVYRNNQPFR